jgi:PRTRC genetic system protein C
LPKRIFVYEGREFPDPNPAWTPEEVRQNMVSFYVELANAETEKTKNEDGDEVYTFKSRVGRKGKFDWDKIVDEMCACGHLKSMHMGVPPTVGHGPCTVAACKCGHFSWRYFVDKERNKL